MEQLEIYGTLGPSCCRKEILMEMFRSGMNGMRLNLSHVNLDECENWLQAFHEAADECGVDAKLLIDMKGPELRIGKLKRPLELKENERIYLKTIPFPEIVYKYITKGQQILLDDGTILLEVEDDERDVVCKVVRGGILKSSKSIALPGTDIYPPTLTESDLHNLSLATNYGVSGIMQPFVRNAQDLMTIKETLNQLGADKLKVYAKIENMDGVNHLTELLPYCDHVIIARGDLGNAMPLYELPAIQKQIQDLCKAHHKPYMVVTQMLHSMHEHAVPTRAEVSDVFYAVYHGASSIMLTGETAAGKYPIEAMKYFVNTAKSALKERSK